MMIIKSGPSAERKSCFIEGSFKTEHSESNRFSMNSVSSGSTGSFRLYCCQQTYINGSRSRTSSFFVPKRLLKAIRHHLLCRSVSDYQHYFGVELRVVLRHILGFRRASLIADGSITMSEHSSSKQVQRQDLSCNLECFQKQLKFGKSSLNNGILYRIHTQNMENSLFIRFFCFVHTR